MTLSSRYIRRPKIAAIAGFVMSSLVGPRPPVVMTPSLRSSASRTAEPISSAESPAVVRRVISTPIAASSRARCAAFVSIVNPSSSSSPIVTTSIFKRISAGDHAAITRDIQNERIHCEENRAGHRQNSRNSIEPRPAIPQSPLSTDLLSISRRKTRSTRRRPTLIETRSSTLRDQSPKSLHLFAQRCVGTQS